MLPALYMICIDVVDLYVHTLGYSFAANDVFFHYYKYLPLFVSFALQLLPSRVSQHRRCVAGRTRGISYISKMAIETAVDKKGIYFITFTFHNWLPLIEVADAYDDVYQFFDV
jgi:hypothetical protein